MLQNKRTADQKIFSSAYSLKLLDKFHTEIKQKYNSKICIKYYLQINNYKHGHDANLLSYIQQIQ
jgi:hypothetical protein